MVPEQARRARLRGGNPLGGSARGPSFFSRLLSARDCKSLYLVKKEGISYEVLHEQLDIRQ
jgi:hypothetical protein